MPVRDRRSTRVSRPRFLPACRRALPALTLAERGVIGAGFALPRDAGQRPALHAGQPSSVFARLSAGAAGPHLGRARRHRGWFRAPARCRSETGAPRGSAVRGFARLSAGAAGPYLGRARRHRRWFRAPARCRSETGAPPGSATRGFARLSAGAAGPHLGRARRHRRWFRAPARCRSEAPTGRTGQRAKPSPRFFSVGDARFR